jgi:hypothetical protein
MTVPVSDAFTKDLLMPFGIMSSGLGRREAETNVVTKSHPGCE